MKREYKILIYIFLILGLLGYTFLYSIQKGMHHVLPEPINRHGAALCVAISELKYGLRGYFTYLRVVNAFFDKVQISGYSIADPKYGEVLKDHILLNNSIQKSLNIENVSSSGKDNLLVGDKGLVDYYKLAFLLFGYRVEGLFYLYFLILTLSVLIFITTFFRHLDLMQILLLFICSHFVVTAAAPLVGIQLQTVHNARFLPVLAILPSIYIALLILGKHRFTKMSFVCTFIQAAILIFIIHIRSSASYQIFFLSMAFCLAVLWFWLKKPAIGKYVFNKVYFWPLGVVYLLFFILQLHLALALNYPHTSFSSKHVFWRMPYISLAAHPESMNKYGIYYSDAVAYLLTERRMAEYYGTKAGVVSPDEASSEEILKKEYLSILRSDPKFVIESYLYKLPIFVKNYLFAKKYVDCSSFGAISLLFKWNVLIIVLLGCLLGDALFLKQWRSHFGLISLGFIFSLLPSLFAMPESYLIADPALLFSLLIYIVFSGLICLLLNLCLFILKRSML